MALTDNQAMYAMYVIGEVESNWNWASVNYTDPITWGMMQWYGYRAAALGNRCKADDATGYAMLADTIRADLEAHPSNDSGFWSARYLTRAEGDSWAKMAARKENHAIQQDQFIKDDIPAYEKVLLGWGLTEDNVKSLIFAMSMYHQGPVYCGQVIATVGNADLDTTWRACLNNRVLGLYTTRYNTVHTRLAAWDGKSAPPDFGQSTQPNDNPGGDAGGGGGTVAQKTGVKRIVLNGNNLMLYNNEFPDGLLCVKGLGQQWIPIANTTKKPPAPNQGGGGGGGQPIPAGDFDKMFQLWKDNANKWQYGQGPGRLNPPSSGYSDCSGCIWWAINSVRPDLAKNIGTWTGTMATTGTEVARGGPNQPVPLDKMQPGDIVLIEWGYVNYAFNDVNSHVEWYVGDGELWGAGKSPLPHDSGKTTGVIPYTGCWMVRRIL